MILIIDFGSQTTHLIGRRVRELGTNVMVINPESVLEEIEKVKPDGIILSGGPASVYEKDAPKVDKKIFQMRIPILGICYGLQLTAYLLGGIVKPGKTKEYGPATLLKKVADSELLINVGNDIPVWMSHGDVVTAPKEFNVVASTETIGCAVMEDKKRKIFGIQFHPEVVHTPDGMKILETFLKICGLKITKHELNKEFVESMVMGIRDSIGNRKAICALSGGVDSSVAALLVHKAIGKNLESVYIDSGLMREGETETLKEVFQKHYEMNVELVNAQEEFLNALRGIIDPEEKRKTIGKTFIEVFDKVAKKSGAKFLVQGTIYPDVIESAGTKHAAKIKSHHNVGGLPENMKLVLVEPLRNFYKDEVRKIGEILGLSKEITKRQPFPGPGLAVRIIGEVTEEKLSILKRADKIVREEIEKAKINLWQYFAVFTGIKTTGVRGDQRFYGETIAIRAIEATDTMSANFAKLPHEILEKISTRIVNEVKEVNRVVYDITNKPPATMEWE